MNSEDNGRPEENDADDFTVSDFDDFGKELDNAVNQSEEQQQTQQISVKNIYIDLLEDFILTYSKGLYFNQIKNSH